MKYYLLLIAFTTLCTVSGCKKNDGYQSRILSPVNNAVFHSGDTIPIKIYYENRNATFTDSFSLSIYKHAYRYDASLLEKRSYEVRGKAVFNDQLVYHTNTIDTLFLQPPNMVLGSQTNPPATYIYVWP